MKSFIGIGENVFLNVIDTIKTGTHIRFYQKLILPLSEEGVLHYTHLFPEVDKFFLTQGLRENIHNIYGNMM